MTGPAVGYSDEGVTYWTAGDDVRPAVDCVPAILRAAGWLIRQARVRQGLRLADMSELCGVSVSVISRVERVARGNRLRVDMLLAMCTALGVRLSDVLRLAEDEAFPLDVQPWTENPAELTLAGYLDQFASSDEPDEDQFDYTDEPDELDGEADPD